MELYHQEATGGIAVQDDPQARELLRRAYATTYRWPKGFAGFRADFYVNNNGQEAKGSVVAKLPDAIAVSLPDPDLQKWAQNQMAIPDGKFLTTQYTVYYFAHQENRLAQVESFTDKYGPIGGIYLPETRTILTGLRLQTTAIRYNFNNCQNFFSKVLYYVYL